MASGGATTLSEFTIAGEDDVYHPATATIVASDTIQVESTLVPKPAAVRYGWHETAMGNLANGAGLPASPFRTKKPARGEPAHGTERL